MRITKAPPHRAAPISIRFRELERELLGEAALSAGLRLSEFVRDAALREARARQGLADVLQRALRGSP